jgi:hypothetical protein
MPTQPTDLLLREDLEDAGRTSEHAESDRDALHAIAITMKVWTGLKLAEGGTSELAVQAMS